MEFAKRFKLSKSKNQSNFTYKQVHPWLPKSGPVQNINYIRNQGKNDHTEIQIDEIILKSQAEIDLDYVRRLHCLAANGIPLKIEIRGQKTNETEKIKPKQLKKLLKKLEALEVPKGEQEFFLSRKEDYQDQETQLRLLELLKWSIENGETVEVAHITPIECEIFDLFLKEVQLEILETQKFVTPVNVKPIDPKFEEWYQQQKNEKSKEKSKEKAKSRRDRARKIAIRCAINVCIFFST